MKLSAWRQTKGLTQAQLGSRLGVATLMVSQWETGRRRPNQQNMQAIFDLTEGAVTANDFYDLDRSAA